jgi:hypothetical protein
MQVEADFSFWIVKKEDFKRKLRIDKLNWTAGGIFSTE